MNTQVLKFLAVFLAFLPSLALANSFCDGYEEGFKAGKCDGNQFCIPPIPPICPIPGIGESTFQDGYNRGFKKGLFTK